MHPIPTSLIAFIIAAGLVTISPGLDSALVLRTAASGADGPRYSDRLSGVGDGRGRGTRRSAGSIKARLHRAALGGRRLPDLARLQTATLSAHELPDRAPRRARRTRSF